MPDKTTPSRLSRLIDDLAKGRVLVVGDLVLDRYLWGEVERISPEAPVPVVHISREEERLGGATNVVNNVSSLGAKVIPLGVIGEDPAGDHVCRMLENRGVAASGLIRDKNRPTSRKSRIIARNQQMIRLDREHHDDLEPAVERKVIDALRGFHGEYDVVIIEDYGKGVVTPDVVQAILYEAKMEGPGKMVVVDPCATRTRRYRGVDLLTPNNHEVARTMGREIRTEEDLESAALEMIDQIEAKGMLVTRGEHGMSLFMKGEEPHHIPTKAREVYDVSGAGDTAVAVMALALAVGATPIEAAHLANYAAGVVVGKFGVATVTVEELRVACRE